MDKFEYMFNGGNLKLENNISELYNNCSYKITIHNYKYNTLIVNNKHLKKINNTFIYEGKLNDNNIIIENCNKDCFIMFECTITNINFKDNTVFTKL